MSLYKISLIFAANQWLNLQMWLPILARILQSNRINKLSVCVYFFIYMWKYIYSYIERWRERERHTYYKELIHVIAVPGKFEICRKSSRLEIPAAAVAVLSLKTVWMQNSFLFREPQSLFLSDEAHLHCGR